MADHDSDGAVVWVGEGKSAATLEAFFDGLGPERAGQLYAVSMDLGGAYAKATRARAPQALICADPFHVIKLANTAVDETRRAEWNRARRSAGVEHAQWGRTRQHRAAQQVKHTRWTLVKDPDDLTADQLGQLEGLRRSRHVLYRAWALKEELRDLYRLPARRRADRHLDAWLAWACRSRIPAMVALSRTVRAHRDEIIAAVELGLSNSKLEGLNPALSVTPDV